MSSSGDNSGENSRESSGKNIYMIRAVEPAKPISFDGAKCTGCNSCVNACPIDLLLPSRSKGETPTVGYPDECWYCGCCVMECAFGAVKLRHPLMNRARWVDKDSLGG